MEDAEYALAKVRRTIDQCLKAMDDDTDADPFCVVPNRIVKELIRHFLWLDEGLLTAEMHIPHEWLGGCPWAPGGDMEYRGECPVHHREHTTAVRVKETV